MGVALRAEEIVERARIGEQVSADERRHAIMYVKGQQPDISARTLAQMFAVSETMIRKDLSKINQDATEETKSTYKETVVQELIAEQHVIYNGLKRSLGQAQLGSNTYVNHLKAMHQVRMDTVRILQDIGALPKNLEEVSAKKEVFKAELQPNTNQIVTRPIDLFDGFQDGESLEQKLAREQRLEILEKEFQGEPVALPTPNDMNGQNSDEEEPG